MKIIPFALALLSTTLVTSPVWAAQALDLPPFDDVGVSGSALVNIRPGARQQVIIREGSASVSEIKVERYGSLKIRTCRHNCPANYRLVVDLVMPRLGDLAVNGSARMVVAPGFAAAGSRDMAVSGSGVIHAPGLSATSMEIAVSGSGSVHVGNARQITAAVSGSGRVGYAGNPAVQQIVSGSGWVGKER